MDLESLSPWPKGQPPAHDFCGEEARASVLAAYGLDALEDDPELAELARFAAQLCDTPVAMVTLVEEERQRFLVRTGIEERETPRPTSFCAHAMLEPELMVVADATIDPRFADNPLVAGAPYVRFYAGAPLISQEGAPLGSFCVIDIVPRPGGLTDLQSDGLVVLASSVMRRLRLRREQLAATEKLARSEVRLRHFADAIPALAFTAQPDGSFDYVNRRWIEFLEESDDFLPGRGFHYIHGDDRKATQNKWQAAIESHEGFEAEFRYRRGDGEYLWVLGRALPFKRNDGSVERWFGTLTDIDGARRRADERELLASELSHRIKNLFAVIGGLVRLKSRDYPDAQPFAENVTKTLDTLGRAHRYVTQEQADSDDTLHGLLGKLLAPYGEAGGSRLSLTGDDVPVRSKSATPLALVFHELATNCAKYGAFSVAKGSVNITTRQQDDRITITWQEVDGPAPDTERGTGFGSRLVEATIKGQLAGKLTRSFPPEGMIATLDVPVTSL